MVEGASMGLTLKETSVLNEEKANGTEFVENDLAKVSEVYSVFGKTIPTSHHVEMMRIKDEMLARAEEMNKFYQEKLKFWQDSCEHWRQKYLKASMGGQ